jgi:serine/threonine protein kinase
MSCQAVQEALLNNCATDRDKAHARACGECGFFLGLLPTGDSPKPVHAEETYGPGDVIDGAYQVLEAKHGGFGCVYICNVVRGALRGEGGPVALKTPLRKCLDDTNDFARFFDEAANWISLGAHPNIVYAYSLTKIGHLPFVVMEYVPGAVTLASAIDSRGADWRFALRVGLGVARALAHAQRVAQLVHGDLKPANILVTPEGGAKVIDFGLSIRSSGGDADTLLCGTKGYIAPEMYLGRTGRSQAADIYAFGVTLFQTATQQWPFPLDRPQLNCAVAPPDPRALATDLPEALATLIRECLGDLATRPESFARLAERLEALHEPLLGEGPRFVSLSSLPDQVGALVNVATAWQNLDQLDKARAAVMRAVKLDPLDSNAHVAMATVHDLCKDYRGAYVSYQRAHELAPNDLRPVVGCARVLDKMGELQSAQEWMATALRLSFKRDQYGPLDIISGLIVDSLPSEEALQVCNAIVDERPDAASTWNNRSILLRRAGRPSEALASIERALEINPVFAKAHVNRANALLEIGRFDEALAAAERGLELDGDLAGGYAARATSLAQLGHLNEARDCIRRGLERLPESRLLLEARRVFN